MTIEDPGPDTPRKPKPEWERLGTIKDSGKRVTFASGSMRDPGEGKIKWSRITFGPMMRRWAQHLTTAEAKYPDPRPGVPNFTLIETDEEFYRYKESAFRHFMSWFFDEVDEDHASATFFNINGVEIIKDKRRAMPYTEVAPGIHVANESTSAFKDQTGKVTDDTRILRG